MSKNMMPKNQQMYRRQTKGYQQNVAKNMVDAEMPKMPTKKQTMIVNIIAVVIVVVLILLCVRFLSWWVAFIPMLLGILYMVLQARYMNRKQMQLLLYYQKCGLNKKWFYKQLEKQEMKQNNIDQYSRMWDIVAGDVYKLTWTDKLLGYDKPVELPKSDKSNAKPAAK